MQLKETAIRNYSKQAYEFVDGKNGFKMRGSYILEGVKQTGIIELSEKKDHQSKWKVEYIYKMKSYDTLGEALKVYESESNVG